MLKNYLKIALRNIFRNRVYSFINVAGLAVGMAACITIFVYVQHEYSFDSFNKKADRIYRVNAEVNVNGERSDLAPVPPSLGPYLQSQFPQIEDVVRVYALDMITSIGNPTLKYDGKVLDAHRFVLVDSTFLGVFSFKMISGDPKTALNAPFSVVLTKSAADRLFGSENPIGKTIRYNNKFTFKVTGVIQDPPTNSTIRFDYLGSLNSLPEITGHANILTASRFEYYTYLLLNKNSDIGGVEEGLHRALAGYWDRFTISMLGLPTVRLERLRDSYWDSSLQYDIPVKGSKASTDAFSFIAAIILLIACANFINLSTARSLNRAKEIGVRKAVGGQRIQLVEQFLAESALMSLVALLGSIALSELFIPTVNKILGLSLRVVYFHDPTTMFVILVIWLLTSLLSGMVPAFYLSSVRPIRALKGRLSDPTGKGFGRRFFILFQFSAAIALIFCTIAATSQYNFLQFHDTGFNKDNIIVLKYDQAADGNYEPFKQRLLENSRILGVTATSSVPGGTFGVGPYFFKSKSKVESLQFHIAEIDPDYIPLFHMKLLAGRNFSPEIPSDRTDAYILNDAAVKKMGLTPREAIGMGFGYPGQVDFANPSTVGHVIGVVKDFNFQSLKDNVEPLVFIMRNRVFVLAVKISSDDIGSTVGFIKTAWKKLYPDSPMQFSFLDRSLDVLYRSEGKMSVLFSWLSILAIIVACLGLYGLALYTAERRTKEIGIRKVLGASVPGVIFALSKEFTEWVIVANIIAWPVAYFLMHNWLENFAYRTSISLWIFPLSGGIALVLALLTVGSHALKAARANPVKSLRYE